MFKILAAVQTIAIAANITLSTNRLVFTPNEDTGAVLNPHKGWVQQVDNAFAVKNASSDIVYIAYDWDDIEKSKGNYDWTAIDNALNECSASGKTLAFGIIPADSDKGGLVPDYVYDDGCKSISSDDLRTPVWDDEKYISASQNLVNAIAQKYDGNSAVEYIDISTFGNKGDWTADGLSGSTMPSADTQQAMLKYWANSFKSTRLAVSGNTSASSYAENVGIVLETTAVGKSTSALKNEIENGSYTFVTFDSVSCPDADFMDEMQNKIGYHFVVRYANLRYEKGDAVLFVKIKNTGADAQTFTFNLGAAITDENGELFTQVGTKQLVRSGTFAADEEKTFEISFPRTNIPNKNNVFIAIGAFELSDSTAPSVRFANKPENTTNYLILGKIK